MFIGQINNAFEAITLVKTMFAWLQRDESKAMQIFIL